MNACWLTLNVMGTCIIYAYFYYRDGEFAFDFNERTEEKILEFMKE